MRKFIAITLLAFMLAVCIPSESSLAIDEKYNDEDTFTIVWLADTQDMAYHGYDHAMMRMGKWISDQREILDIRFVVQTGDAVDNGLSSKQWAEFDLMFDAFKDEIPYIGLAGNHEIPYNDYSAYLERPEVRSIPTQNAYKNGEASFSTLEVDGCKIIFVAIGYNIGEESVHWVNSILQNHKDYSAILLYHDYLQTGGRFSKNGKSMFKQVVMTNSNVRLVLCGHVCEGSHSLSSRIDAIDDDNDGTPDRTVTQMMYNYQRKPYNDNGQLRTMLFNTTNHSITVSTYSPLTNRFYRDWTFGDNYTFLLEDAF